MRRHGRPAIILALLGAANTLAQPPATGPAAGPTRPPLLPIEVRQRLDDDQDAIRDAWANPTDAARFKKGLDAALDLWKAHEQFQGPNWWETQVARDMLASLKRISGMPPARRVELASAEAIRTAFDRAIAAKDFVAAGQHGVKFLDQLRTLLGDDDYYYVNTCDDIWTALRPGAKAAEMLEHARTLLTFRQHHYTGDNPDVARSLLDVAGLMCDSGESAEALEMARQALTITRSIADTPDDETVVEAIKRVALCALRSGHTDEALACSKEVLLIARRDYPGDALPTACALRDVADCLCVTRRPAEALEYYGQAIDMSGRMQGPDSTAVAALRVAAGDAQQDLGRFDAACVSYAAAAAIQKAKLPPVSATTADTLGRLAKCMQARGQLDQALLNYEATLAIREKLHPEPDWSVAIALNNLGVCKQALGLTADALAKFDAAGQLQEKLSADPRPATADTQINIAYCRRAQDGAAAALPQMRAALDVCKALRPVDPSRVATALNNLASCQLELGETDKAQSNLEMALALRRSLGDAPADVGDTLQQLGECDLKAGRPDAAAERLREAIALRRSTFGPDHLDVAVSLSTDGRAEAALGHWAEATDAFSQAARIKWTFLTHTFPVLSDEQKKHYLDHTAMDEQQQLTGLAVTGQCPAATALNATLLTKQLLLEVSRQERGELLAASESAPSAEWIAQWKQQQALRREYATAALVNAQLLTSPDSPNATNDANPSARAQALADRIEQIDQNLRKSNPAYAARARVEAVTVRDVTAELRPDQALLEYITFVPPNDPAAKAHYAAFVLRGGTGAVTVTDLGPVSELNELVREYRSLVLQCVGQAAPRLRIVQAINRAAAALYQRAVKPLEASTSGVRRFYIAPTSWLLLFPFETMATGGDDRLPKYLVQDCEIVYVNTGRDLVRLARSPLDPSSGTPTAVLIGNPAFDESPQAIAASISGRSATTAPAPGAASAPAAEASALPDDGVVHETDHAHIPRSWPQVPMLEELIEKAATEFRNRKWRVTTIVGDAATEECVGQLHSPTVLQVATHGFMLGVPGEADETAEKSRENPLLQSMLIMAGQKRWTPDDAMLYPSGDRMLTRAQAVSAGVPPADFEAHAIPVGDGCLTAYEVSNLDLHNTQFVNLTACDTGLGIITPDGVAGLRKGFLLAGARSLTMSMWEIPAELAPKAAEDFYAGWLGDAAHPGHLSRYAAFRAAELKLLDHTRGDGRGSPHLWAGMVYVGDPGDLPTVTPATMPTP